MSKKILIIDDNEGDKVLIRELLRESGIDCEFIMTGSGPEVIEKTKQEKPDVVLIDTGLKEMDSFQTCKTIKDMPDVDIKVIVMTGIVDAIDAGKARRSGADDFCVKTSDCESIIKAIKQISNQS